MAKPVWSIRGATPAAVGTSEAAAAQKQSGGPVWSIRGGVSEGPAQGAVNWASLTGQNMEGTHNAFDTDFWAEARRQDEEQATRGMRDRFTRADATGIAVYDDPDQGVAFGDVYLNGIKQGNLRSGYGGFDRVQSNEMLARMVLPREVWARAYESEQGKPGTLAGTVEEELEKVRQRNTENYAKGLSAQEFESDVRERAAGYEASETAQVLNVGAGAAGGAAVGAGIGSVLPGVGTALGAGVGAALGAVGAWLNRDEAFTRAAQAAEQYELAKQAGITGVGVGDAVSGWVGVAAGTLSPLRNVTRGIYDAVEGESGDQRSTYNEQGAPLWFDVLDTAALVADGIGTFGTRVAAKAYTATMGATVGGELVSWGAGATAGNVAFNPYSGSYEDIGAGGMALRAGSIAIDAAQTGAAGVLARGLRRGTLADSQGGHVIRRAPDGTGEATRLGMSALIPSEAATAVSARMLTRRTARREGITDAGELARIRARHIENLTTGRKPLPTMMVNAFGEGAEEFVQAGLDALSVGELPTFAELVSAYRQGAAMGAGMGLGVARTSLTRGQVQLQRANALRLMRGQEPLSEEDWAGQSETQRAMLATTATAQQERELQLVAKEIERAGGKFAAANIPELQRATEVVLRQAEQEARNSQELVESSLLSTRSNHDWAPQDYVVSLGAAIRDVSARARALARVVAGEHGEVDPEQVAYAQRVLGADQALVAELERRRLLIDGARANGDVATVRREVGELNAVLRDWWHAKESSDPEAYGKRRSAAVWGARFPLNAAGSFQLLRLQISPELTLAGNDYTAQVPDEIQPPMGGDFDGDRIINMLREYLPDESFDALRYGAGQLTAEGTMLNAKPYVVANAEVLFDALAAEPGTPQRAAGDAARRDLARRLHEILDRSSIPDLERDRLIARAVNDLSSRRAQQAMSNLMSELATRFQGPMRQLAELMDDSPWLAINRTIEDGLREMATAVSLTDLNKPSETGAVVLPATSKAMPAYAQRPLRATSELITGAIQTSSWNIFREQTILKYNELREGTRPLEAEEQLAIQGLIERFTALNDGLVRSGDEAAFEGTIAQDRTITFLEEIARESMGDLGTNSMNEALVLMASARVPDVEVRSASLRGNETVTLLQSVLHEVVTGLRREYAPILHKDPSVAMRLESLDSLTRPDREEGTHTKAVGGNAFVEVLGAYPLTELLGDAAAPVQSFTVRGLRDHLVAMRRDVREQFVSALHAHPHYTQELPGGARITPYRATIDMIVESARMELTEDADGVPVGARTRADTAASESFAKMHDALRALATARKMPHGTGAEVRAFLAANPRLAERVLAVMEERGLQAGLVERTAEGDISRVEFPQWIYEVLAEPVTARAEMMMLRETLRFTKALYTHSTALDVEKVSDRILRLWLDLDHRAEDTTNPRMAFDSAARDAFVDLLFGAGSVREFISGLNSDFRFRPERSAPYMAWTRDRSVVEADRFGKGISDVVDGQEMREALRDAADAAARERQIVADTEAYLKSNAALIDQIRSSRDEGADPVPWQRFKKWFELTRELPNLISVSVMIEQAAHVNEILGGMGVKGMSPTNVQALGKAIAAQLPTFDSAMGRLLASATSSSFNAVLADMTHLARGQRHIVMNDGTVVDWQGISAEEALDMLADPKRAGLAARLMGLTAWDLNSESGVTTLASLVGKGVAGFSQAPGEELFSRDQLAKFRRISVLEGMAAEPGGAPIVPVMLALQMNLRETAVDHVIDPRSEERQRMAVAILEDIADALQAVASIEGLHVHDTEALTTAEDELTGETTTLLNRVLRKAGARARGESGSLVGKILQGLDGDARTAAMDAIRGWQARLVKRAFTTDDEAGKALARALADDIRQADNWTSPVELLVDEYKHFEQPEVQARIVSTLRAWGDVANTVAWARPEILRATSPTTPQVEAGGHTVPAMTTAQWETLARAVIAYTMHTAYGVATSAETQIAEFPSLTDADQLAAQLPYWDPSGASLVLDFFAPGVLSNPHAAPSKLLLAQLELQREFGADLEPITPERAEAAVHRLFAPRITDPTTGQRSGVVGQWHALLPALYHSAVGAVMASSAQSGIEMAGTNPGRMRFFGATTGAEWTQPDDAELSQTVLPAGALVTAVDQGQLLSTEITVQRAEGTATGITRVERAGRLAHLEGRVARVVELITPEGETISLLGHPRFSPGLVLPSYTGVPAGEAAALSVQTLSDSVAQLLAERGVYGAERDDYQLRIDFFHPATKAVSGVREPDAQYSHNGWYDGVGGRTDAAFSQSSLMGFLYYGLDGVIPAAYDRSLGAIKKLHSALQQVTTMPESLRRSLMAQGTTDMAGMVDSMTEYMLRQKIDGKPIPARNYNALRKFVETMFVVRHVENDVPAVLSVDEVIARQQRGEGLGDFAEVVGLPMEHVLALMGEKDLAVPHFTAHGVQDYTVDVAGAQPYLRFPAEAWTDQMFGGLVRLERGEGGAVVGWASVDLTENAQLLNLALPRATTRRWDSLGGGVARDPWSAYRTQQARIHEDRSQHTQANTKWAAQRASTRAALDTLRNENLVAQVMMAVDMQLAGDHRGAANYRTGDRDTAVASHDYTTGWIYRHHGARSGSRIDGVLTAAGEVDQSVTLGDVVHVVAADFMTPGVTLEAAIPQAREVLDAIMATGATVNLPDSPRAQPLVSAMRRYLRESSYAPVSPGATEYVPVVSEVRSQTEAAYHSMLQSATHRTARNRVLLDLSDSNGLNENAIASVNGGLGALEDYFARELIQTARYAGYAPPTTREQELAVVKALAPVLSTEDGRTYLAGQSTEELTDEEATELDAALDALARRVDRVRTDELAGFLPQPGERLATGDLIPLVSYNARGELVGIHLYRHGHESVRERDLRGAVHPDNQALGLDVRLTIDRARVDENHTTHDGDVVETKWLGLQGFLAKVRLKASDLGSKVFELGTGMKWTTTTLAEDVHIPSHPIAAGKPVLGAGDLTSPDAKNSDQWWLNTPSRVVEFAGFDVMPHLTRAILRQDYTQENANAVRGLLRSFAAEHGHEARAEDVVRRNTNDLEQVLIAQLQDKLRKSMSLEVDLLDNSTNERLADLTMLRLVLTALSTGARLEEVLGAPGYLDQGPDGRSHTMHPVFTTLLEQLPADHPAKAAYVQQVNARMAQRRASNGDGYTLNPDGHSWTRRVTRPDGRVQHVQTMLAFPAMGLTDTNDSFSLMADDRKQRGSLSPTTLSMAYVTWGADSLIDRTKLTRASSTFEENAALHGTPTQLAQRTFNVGVAAAPFGIRADGELPMNAAEVRHIFTEAMPARQALAVEIDDSGWYDGLSKAKRAAAQRDFRRDFARVLRKAHLRDSERIYLVEMIRAVVARPADVNREEGEFLTRDEAVAALKLIERNLDRGDYPTHGGAINVVSRDALEAMRRGGYELRAGDGSLRPADSWEDWVDVVLAEAFSDDPELRGYPAVFNVIDGLMYEYRKDVVGMPTSVNKSREMLLKMVETDNRVIMAGPQQRDRANAPSVQDGQPIYDTTDFVQDSIGLEELPQDARAIVEKRMSSWERRNNMQRRRATPRSEAKRGAQVRQDIARTNMFMRFLQLGYVLKTMINPGLHASAYLEIAQRAGQEKVVSFLSGDTLGQQGFTAEQRQLWKDTRRRLADNHAFYSMVYSNTNWDPTGQAETRLEQRVQRATNFLTAVYNDPAWGTRGDAMAQAFMEAAWDSLNKGDSVVTPEQFLNTLATNPEALESISPDAVRYGYSRIEYRRNLQDNLAERTRRWAVEGVINSGGPGTNSLGVLLLRIPTLFFRFRSNTLINLMGLQAPHAVLTSLLSDRTKRPGGLKDYLTKGNIPGEDSGITDQAKLEDAVDLTRAIIRSGVSHTQLFMLGSLLSAAGFGGDEEEEERLLGKLRRYQKTPVAKDPLQLENDFRNAQAWFNDMLPAGMGVPSWVMKMFVSPAMGFARFHETGDFRQVFWGFQDALGAMPLLNLDNVMNSWEIANELAAAAQAEAMEDNVESSSRAYRLMLTAVGTLEAMLFESAFATMIYQASDEWDRDPYAVPLRDAEGNLMREGVYNTPRATDALQSFVDPVTGEVRQGYVGRNDTDALIRGMAERRPVLAAVMSLIKRDSTYLRTNMPVKTREVKSEQLEQDEAIQLIMSIVSNERGEELTIDGAEAVVRGIHLGTVRADSPALTGVWIPREMKTQIQARVLEELTAKYLDLGYGKKDALNSAKAEFYGQGYGEEEGLGFADILWGESIPEYQSQKYMQLNTTYVMGPNGRPVATGLARSALAAFGLPMFEGFHAGDNSNLSVDQLLNSVDDVRGINLGLRGLVKLDETWLTPTPEEIGEGIEKAIREIGDKIDDLNDSLTGGSNGWRNFGRRGYGRGGGYSRRGGGGYSGGYVYPPDYSGMALRLDSQRRVGPPRADDLYSINTSNPIIRRATIRRERFSSQRGRLNQWQ